MSRINNQKNHARQLLSVIVATAILTSLFAVTSYSGTRPHSSRAANAATVSRTQPQTLKQNGKIAFVRSGQIYVMDADGSNQTRLTDNQFINFDPAFSPDGTKIAFASYRDDPKAQRSEIYVMNADGSNQKRLTNSPDESSSSQPTWSPDGARIAYIHGDRMSMMNADGSGVITIETALNPQYPAWSPDGTKIAFSGCVDGCLREGILVMNADGSGLTPLAQGSDFLEFYYAPAWSPDGAKLAFGYASYDFFGDLVTAGLLTMNLDGSNEQVIAGYVSAVSWSPDGEKIAFDDLSAANSDITIANINGSNSLKLTNNQGSNYHPSWGPSLSAPGPNTVQFSSASYTVSEGSPRVDITLSRTGDTTSSASVSFATNDGAGLQDCNVTNGIASPRCDYINTFGTMSFAAGQASKAFSIAVVDDSYAEGNETFTINLSGASGATLGTQSTATVTITDNDSSNGPNPIDSTDFFVRQQYLDFLGREPDPGGLAYWTNQIIQCGSDARCIHDRRIGVSAAFFVEQEFQDTGYFVDRLYKASFGRQPNFAEFTADRSKVIGGSSLEANKQAFADEWVQRQAFRDADPITLSNTEFVNKVFDTAGLTAASYDAQRQQEIQAMNAGGTRALVLRDVIEIPAFKNIPDPNDPGYSELKQTSQYNPAFVLMQYFGYLHRDVDQSGYAFWLDVLNNREPNNYRGMVCSFLTSSEYQLRFGSTVTRTNADCGQ